MTTEFVFEQAIYPFTFEKSQLEQDLIEIEQRSHELINQYRKQMGLVELKWDQPLRDLSQPHNQFLNTLGDPVQELGKEIVEPNGRKTKMAHKGFGDRFDYCAKKLGRKAGRENVYWCSDSEDLALSAVEGWKSSPGHNANILVPELRREGIAVFRGSQGYYFTQLLTD